MAQVDDSTGVIEYLHSDLLGTPRLLTDVSGGAVGSVSFDAFGNRATYTGVQSAFGITVKRLRFSAAPMRVEARGWVPPRGRSRTRPMNVPSAPVKPAIGVPVNFAGGREPMFAERLVEARLVSG